MRATSVACNFAVRTCIARMPCAGSNLLLLSGQLAREVGGIEAFLWGGRFRRLRDEGPACGGEANSLACKNHLYDESCW